MTSRKWALTTAAIVLGGTAALAFTPLGRDLLFYVLPLNWTGEAMRLGAALEIGNGSVVADIGAGDGALIVELARLVGPQGAAYATERSAGQLRRIKDRATSIGVPVTVVAAADHSTNLPNACCDAITMRMVMHHIADPETFARDLRRSVRAGGRVGILDFAPGVLPFLGDRHGVTPADVTAAFVAAGFSEQFRDDHWGGRTYLIVFRAP